MKKIMLIIVIAVFSQIVLSVPFIPFSLDTLGIGQNDEEGICNLNNICDSNEDSLNCPSDCVIDINDTDYGNDQTPTDVARNAISRNSVSRIIDPNEEEGSSSNKLPYIIIFVAIFAVGLLGLWNWIGKGEIIQRGTVTFKKSVKKKEVSNSENAYGLPKRPKRRFGI